MKKQATSNPAAKSRKRKMAIKKEVSTALNSDLANLNDPPHINDSQDVKNGTSLPKKKEKFLADQLDEENE